MIRLHFLVEGATERTFVDEVLKPELSRLNIFPDVCCVQTGRKQGKVHKGGIISYLKLKKDLQRWLKQDKHQEARFTTMVYFYALPNDFPGYEKSRKQKGAQKRIEILEHYFQADIGDYRFIPSLFLTFNNMNLRHYCFLNRLSLRQFIRIRKVRFLSLWKYVLNFFLQKTSMRTLRLLNGFKKFFQTIRILNLLWVPSLLWKLV